MTGLVQGTPATAGEALLRSLTDATNVKSTTHYIIAPVDGQNGKRASVNGNVNVNGNGNANGSMVSAVAPVVKDNTPGVRDIDLNLVRVDIPT